MGQNHINIDTMQNMSKKAWAYTVLDVEGEITPEIIASLEAIEGVVRVRIL